MAGDLQNKKIFLFNSSRLYNDFIGQTKNDCLRRFLAFKIIVNGMCYEDLIGYRMFPDFRVIRNVFLAHKQEGDFFEAFNAAEKIGRNSIKSLMEFMQSNLDGVNKEVLYLKCCGLNPAAIQNLLIIVKGILQKFENDFYFGTRISTNFLCNQKGQIKEISSNPIASIFYRYNSSKELSILANYFLSNFSKPEHEDILLQFKNEYILHCVNMHDCLFKDRRNSYSIDGLYEVLLRENIQIDMLENLKNDKDFLKKYKELRNLRNHISGHIDKQRTLQALLDDLKRSNLQEAFDFFNKMDSCIQCMCQNDIRLRAFSMNNIPLNNIEVVGRIQNIDYDSV